MRRVLVVPAVMTTVQGLRRPVPIDRDLFYSSLTEFGDGELVELRIRSMPRRQANGQMRYYRGVIIPDITRAIGEMPTPGNCERVHQALAWIFLRVEDHPIFHTPERKSTGKKDFSSQEMTDFLSDVIQYGETEIVGCRIRRPHEVDLDTTPETWRAP